MKQTELIQKINDAADGLLSSRELKLLEQELEFHPELMQDYQNIMSLPELSKAYKSVDRKPDKDLLDRLQGEFERLISQPASFEEITLEWFRKYALAAALAVFVLVSLFNLMQSPTAAAESDIAMDEIIYSYEEDGTELYVYYLEELIELQEE